VYTKIKWDGNQVTLCWADQPTAKRSETHEMTSSEEPPPEFLRALQAFVPWVCACLGVTAEALDLVAQPTRLEVRGVTRSTGDQGGCVVTSLLSTSVASSPMVLNTPWVPETSSGDSPTKTVPDYVADALVNLDRWAARYHKGERAQADMFGGAESPEGEAPAPAPKATEDLVMLRALERLAPSEKGGIDSVTLSVMDGGKERASVTLTKDSGRKFRQKIRELTPTIDPRD
jgi:hypothetical protein